MIVEGELDAVDQYFGMVVGLTYLDQHLDMYLINVTDMLGKSARMVNTLLHSLIVTELK